MESLHYLLMKTHTILNRQILNCAGKVGLTAGQPKVLEFLSQHGESDQKTIASYCEIEPATVGSILLRMERSGLVVRRQHEGNRRSLFVSLTEQGEQAAVGNDAGIQRQLAGDFIALFVGVNKAVHGGTGTAERASGPAVEEHGDASYAA